MGANSHPVVAIPWLAILWYVVLTCHSDVSGSAYDGELSCL